jgi:hypothetical protein
MDTEITMNRTKKNMLMRQKLREEVDDAVFATGTE